MTPEDTALHTVRILHISDLHERELPDGLPDDIKAKREAQIRRDRTRRPEVLSGDAWRDNLVWLQRHRPYHIVAFTGDIADWGLKQEYIRANRIIADILEATGLGYDRLFCVPGNHDIRRDVQKDVWSALRERSGEIGAWLANESEVPHGMDNSAREKILEREEAFWDWVSRPVADGGLGRIDLQPSRHAHGRLGYRAIVSDPTLPFPIHVVGLDTAWLAGDIHDSGKLRLTDEQVRHLTMDGETLLPGLRLALGHHPLSDLAEQDRAQNSRLLADRVDLYLHGHQHDPAAQIVADPDRALRIIAAGCLFEGSSMNRHANGFHIIEAHTLLEGRPTAYTMRFRGWSERGHWHDASALYRAAPDGTLTWLIEKREDNAGNSTIKPDVLEALTHQISDQTMLIRELMAQIKAQSGTVRSAARLQKLMEEARIHFERAQELSSNEEILLALRSVDDARRLAEDDDASPELKGSILNLSSALRLRAGSLTEARDHAREAAELLGPSDDLLARGNLGLVHLDLQQPDEAKREFLKVLDAARKAGDMFEVARTSMHLARVCMALDDDDGMMKYADEMNQAINSLASDEPEHVPLYLHVFGTKGQIYLHIARKLAEDSPSAKEGFSLARKDFEYVVQNAQQYGFKSVELMARCNLAQCLWYQNLLLEAERMYKSVTVSAGDEFAKIHADALYNVALLQHVLERHQDKIESMLEALSLYRRIDDAPSAQQAEEQLGAWVRLR